MWKQTATLNTFCALKILNYQTICSVTIKMLTLFLLKTLLPVLSADLFYCQMPNLHILYAPKHIFNFKLLYHETTNRFFLFLSRKSGKKTPTRFLPCKSQWVGQNTEAFLPSEYPQSSERALCFGSLASQINIRSHSVTMWCHEEAACGFAASVYALTQQWLSRRGRGELNGLISPL